MGSSKSRHVKSVKNDSEKFDSEKFDPENFDFDSVTTPNNFIDKGAFGEVYGPFTWNNKKCALKQILISPSEFGDLKTEVEEKSKIWTSLKHKNLIEIHNVILRPKVLYFVMEYASGGSLTRLLHDSDFTYKRNISNWARQIAEGMRYLHEADIVHRDLKCSNIMLSEPFDAVNTDKEITLKITDFDEAREHDHTTTVSFRGTCAYMAPEVLQTERFSKSSDIWSYGIVLLEMLTREHAHEGLGNEAIIEKAKIGQLMHHISESVPERYEKLLHECLHDDKDRRLSFQSISDQLLSIENDEDKSRNEYKVDPVLVHMFKTKAAEEKMKAIMGFTILNNELFVVSEESSEVEVFDSLKFSFSRRWNLKKLINPQNIASCNRNKCLYFVGGKFNYQRIEILRVKPNGKLIKKWPTESYYTGLSVTDDSNVLLTLCMENTLNEYSPDGQLIRKINVESEDWYLLHSIKLTNGHFMVSFGGDSDYYLKGVCIVDESGNVTKSFSGEYGSTIGELDNPFCFAVDGNGFVMVADSENNRVILLDSDLEFKREILTEEKHGLRCPLRIILQESSHRLLVIDNDSETENGRILSFEFR